MRHAILGVGAIGGLMGTVLASLGEDVTAIVRAEKLAGYPERLMLERPSGTLTAPVKAVAALDETVDVLWIATKTYQLAAALKTVAANPRYVVPLLNGVDHMATLRERFGKGTGKERVIAATIAVEAESAGPGRFIQRSQMLRFNLAASGEALLGEIVERLGAEGFSCRFIANESTLLWSKLCFLGPFALVTTASGMNLGEILGRDEWKNKAMTAIDEFCAVANFGGAQIDARRMREVSESAPPAMRSSMQKDLAAGRRLELDSIAGPVVRGGREHGVSIATTEGLMAEIRTKAASQS